MPPGSRALSFVFFPTLLLGFLVLAGPGGAVITKKERDKCGTADAFCLSDCGDRAARCREKYEASVCRDRAHLCEDNCADALDKCLRDADKSAPKAPPTKVPPKVKPGGAEQPGTESPAVPPKGGIQRY